MIISPLSAKLSMPECFDDEFHAGSTLTEQLSKGIFQKLAHDIVPVRTNQQTITRQVTGLSCFDVEGEGLRFAAGIEDAIENVSKGILRWGEIYHCQQPMKLVQIEAIIATDPDSFGPILIFFVRFNVD